MSPRAHGWLAALIPSAVLVAYGNLTGLGAWTADAAPVIPAVGHPVLVAAALLWARGPARLSWAELGLGRRGWWRGARLGLAVAGGMALVVGALLLLARAIGWGSQTLPPIPRESGAMAQEGLRLLLATALCEELWFRGLLQACWVRLLGPARGIAVTVGLFVAWHLAVWAWTLTRVTLEPPLPLALTYPAGLLAFAVGGALFGWLRQRSGHLAGPIVAHWLIDAVIVGLVLLGWL